MSILSLQIGDIVTARFPQQNPQAHEQEGHRPAIVVGLPDRLGSPRFSLVILVPITSDRGQVWANDSPDLHPKFPAVTAGLRQPSIALLDQIRVLDVTRITEYWDRLTPEEYEPILTGLKRMIAL